MAELLLELYSEEIPARMQARAADDLRGLVEGDLKRARLDYAEARSFVTPQRLVLAIDGLATAQPDLDVERRGPRVGAPPAALDGFLRSLGTDDYELVERDDHKGKVYLARFRQPGRPADALLGELLADVLARFPWPKSMRWGNHQIRWVRPLRRILCLLDGAVVPLSFGPLSAADVTSGHRFHAPDRFTVRGFADYRERLAGAYVVLDRDERRRRIATGAERLARAEGLLLRADPELLDELTGLVEWPVPLLGRIDDDFMSLPAEVLVTSMRQHQKYLALQDDDGRLAPRFVVVANVEARDPTVVVDGNERVLRARLWDARFFWEQDREAPLEGRLPALRNVVFHARLGTLGDKALRLDALAGWLARALGDAPAAEAERAALLCKADLVSGMVGEFPELQGVMGGYYARHQGEPATVADAVAEHYAPQGPGDRCPTAPVSVAVALADKLDTLAGFFAVGERPTGSKDPFALRRAALGAIRLVVENGLRLSLLDAFKRALAGYGEQLAGVDRDAVADDLLSFFAERLRVHLRGQGTRHDLIAAAFAAGRDDDLNRLLAKVAALQELVASPDGEDLLTAFRRAANIVRIEEKRDGRSYDAAPDPARLVADEERALHDALERAERNIARALDVEDFAAAMAALAALRAPVDAFFDSVTVNAEDAELRANRLFLLARIRSSLAPIAELALIEDAGPTQARVAG